jgi:hypothetical protein
MARGWRKAHDASVKAKASLQIPLARQPGKERTEVHTFTPEHMEKVAKSMAKMAIVGQMFHGEIFEQRVVKEPDGSLSVFTRLREDVPVRG